MSEQISQPRFPRRGRRLILGGVAVAALVVAAAGAAKAVEEHHHGMWSMDGGIPVERIEQRADKMLGKVAATPEQQAKIHAIIEAAAKDIEPLRREMTGTRAQFSSLLTAPSIDRAAVEQLRAGRAAAMDKISQRLSVAVEDAADVLTPDQRARLKGVMEEFVQHRHG